MKLAMCDTHLYVFACRRQRVWWYASTRQSLTLVRYDMRLDIYFN